MMDPVRELKIRAELLQTRLASNDAAALARLRALPALRRADEAALAAAAPGIGPEQCLEVVARECGFSSWERARLALEGAPDAPELGTLLHGGDDSVLHHWFATHDEARAHMAALPEAPRSYLLAYRHHFFVAGRAFVAALGLDPDDPDWQAIGWDWARPADPAARSRLYGRRLAAMRGQVASGPELHPDLSAALAAAFPGRPVRDVTSLSGGLSGATLIAFVVDGAPYVAKRVDALEPGDPERAAREIACLRIASERGVAPRLRHADARTGVTIMDRFAGAPLRPSGDPTLLDKIATALRRLHDGPPFPRGPSRLDFLRSLDAQCAALAGAGLPAELVRTAEELERVSAPHAHAAPCHRDVNPNNVLVAADRVVFVDWTTAGAGDPFVDLAQLGVFALPRPEQREALLHAYLGRSASDEERARAHVARAIALAFYAAGFFLAGARVDGSRGSPPADEEPRPLADVIAAFGAAPERTHPGTVAASLLHEMRREARALGAARDRS
ncbi:phosphotransferase [Sorangium sp. So ce1182]|uniref:phosphotransferase n=1 Tax=Sorangium sp. So ce1182 TaxID=3133334 RepID=UPI003F6276EC